MKVKIGSIYAIGYVSNIMQHGWHGQQIELTKIVYVIGGEPQLKDPTRDNYFPEQLEPIGGFWDKHRDRSVLIDLALQTGDKEWFEELTGRVIQHEPT